MAGVILILLSLMKTSGKASHFPSEYTSFFHSGKKKIQHYCDNEGETTWMGQDKGMVRTEAPGPITVNSIYRADTAIWLYELG